MPNAAGPITPNQLRGQLERLAREFQGGASPVLGQAIEATLTAIDSKDSALLRSHLNTAFEALRDLIRRAVQKRLGRPQVVKEMWVQLSEGLTAHPAENFDELGKEFEALLDELLEDLIGLRDGPLRMLRERRYAVENAGRMEEEIEELRRVREDFRANWPWSSRELPPVDRGMVAESRAAIRRGEGERIEDLIRRLGGVPARGDATAV